jgi:hypothetical protein
MVRKEQYDVKDLDLILQAKKWRKKGFMVFVQGSVHCYGCENTMPLESSEANPNLEFIHAGDCELDEKERKKE